MDNRNLLNLKYYGRAIYDYYLIPYLENQFNIKFVINPNGDLETGTIKSNLTWLYDSAKGFIIDSELLLSYLVILYDHPYRFLAVNISINNNHRNILIIDNQRKMLYYFEPNDCDLSDVTDYEAQNEKHNTICGYILNLVKGIEKYQNYRTGTRLRNLSLIYAYSANYFDDAAVKEVIKDGSCANLTYYVLYKILNDDIDYSNLSNSISWFDMLTVLINIFEKVMAFNIVDLKNIMYNINNGTLPSDELRNSLHKFTLSLVYT